jgi:hypothetical protein
MTEFNQTDTRDPAEIEREIRSTQAEMSRTADQIGDQLTPKNLLNSLLDKADQNGVDARYLLDGARRNPIALAMIALGGIWLVSESDAKASTIKPAGGFKMPSFGSKKSGRHHSDYVEHMSRCEQRPDEDDASYLRRRAQARANYLMIEQRHDEDEKSFRDRLDHATEALRQQRHDFMNRAKGMGQSARSGAGDLGGKASTAYRENPLVGGAIAAVAGAIVGAALPATRTEKEQLGSVGAKALDAAKEKASQLGDTAREKKDVLMGEARATLEG